MCSKVFFRPAPFSKLRNLEFRTACRDCQEDGIVFAIVGTCGEGFYPLDVQATYTATQFTRLGFLNINISDGNPHTELTGTIYDNKGDEVRDSLQLKRKYKLRS